MDIVLTKNEIPEHLLKYFESANCGVCYFCKILEVIKQLWRVLKKDGQLWWNVGDCYGTKSGGTEQLAKGINETQYGQIKYKAEKFAVPQNNKNKQYEKCLLMMPERTAIAMIEQGWTLRQDVIWAKQILNYKEKKTMGSSMPSSVKDRMNCTHEHLYFFVKNKRYYSDLDAVRIPVQSELNIERPRMGQDNQTIYSQKRAQGIDREKKYPEAKRNKFAFNYRVRDAVKKDGQPQFKASEREIKNYPSKYGKGSDFEKKYSESWDRFGSKTEKYQYAPADGRKEGSKTEKNYGLKYNRQADNLKNIPSVWLLGYEPHKFATELDLEVDHFAAFPQDLVTIPILFGTKEGDIVLDPFGGSMTTGLVAKKLNRKYIMIELNKDYCELGRRRLGQEVLPI